MFKPTTLFTEYETNSIPRNLQYLNITCVPINVISNWPQSFRILHLKYGNINEIDNLPEEPEQLVSDGNQITRIKNLPKNLSILSVYDNLICVIENIPDSVEDLNTASNPIKQFYAIPTKCQRLQINSRDEIKKKLCPNYWILIIMNHISKIHFNRKLNFCYTLHWRKYLTTPNCDLMKYSVHND